MLDTLRLIQGSVSTKDLMPVMKHFYIYNERIQGQNGRVALDAPLPGMRVSLTVPADRFVKAVDACDSEPDLTITAQKVVIKAGKFRASLPILANDAYPRDSMDPSTTALTAPILPLLRKLAKFISDDASHVWSLGVKFFEGYAYATNNVTVVKAPYPMADHFTLPIWAIDEMTRIGEEPVSYGVGVDQQGDPNSITFHYQGGIWLKAYLISQDFPSAFSQIFEDWPEEGFEPIPPDLKQAIEKVVPFCPDSKLPAVILKDDLIMTMDGEQSAAVSGFDFPEEIHVNSVMILPVLDIADRMLFVDPRLYFTGEGIQGVSATYRRST